MLSKLFGHQIHRIDQRAAGEQVGHLEVDLLYDLLAPLPDQLRRDADAVPPDVVILLVFQQHHLVRHFPAGFLDGANALFGSLHGRLLDFCQRACQPVLCA